MLEVLIWTKLYMFNFGASNECLDSYYVQVTLVGSDSNIDMINESLES